MAAWKLSGTYFCGIGAKSFWRVQCIRIPTHEDSHLNQHSNGDEYHDPDRDPYPNPDHNTNGHDHPLADSNTDSKQYTAPADANPDSDQHAAAHRYTDPHTHVQTYGYPLTLPESIS